MRKLLSYKISGLLLLIGCIPVEQVFSQSQTSKAEKERNKAYAQERFAQNFRELQVNSQKLLKEHKSNSLTPNKLSKHVRNINKNAKNLKSLLLLWNLGEKEDVNEEITTPEDFDKSIRKLADLVWDFAHNPIHKNSKVFNTDQAARAQTDLLTIIDLSRILGDTANGYSKMQAFDQ